MNAGALRSHFRQGLALGWRSAVVPAGLGLAAMAAAVHSAPPLAGVGEHGLWAAATWLHLPAFLVTASAIIAAIDGWPLFGSRRVGAATVGRLCHSPLDGCGARTAAALLSLLPCLLVTGLGVAAVLAACGAPQPAVARISFARATAPRPVLDRRQPVISFAVDGHRPVRALRFNPVATLLPGGELDVQRLHVELDGASLGHEIVVAGSHESQLVALPESRPVAKITIRRVGAADAGGLLLAFPPGSVELLHTGSYPAAFNLAVAATMYLFGAALALAGACLGRRHLGAPVLMALALTTLVLSVLAGLSPEVSAVQASARGRWVLSEGVLEAGVPATLLASTVLAVAMISAVIRRFRTEGSP